MKGFYPRVYQDSCAATDHANAEPVILIMAAFGDGSRFVVPRLLFSAVLRTPRRKSPKLALGIVRLRNYTPVLRREPQSPTLVVGMVRLPSVTGAREPNHPHDKRGGFPKQAVRCV